MILIVDVHYVGNTAKVSAGLFDNWKSSVFSQVYQIYLDSVSEYISGEFYKRELPCILKILKLVKENYDFIVIDGYVYLGETEKVGLGWYLWDALDIKKPIIGVAKNYFKNTPDECFIFRGGSIKPLYITSIGLTLGAAKQHILEMSGEHRLPTLIKEIDLHSRKNVND